MGRKFKKNDNFLDLIPIKNTELDWEEDEKGRVRVILKRDKLLEKLVRPFIKSPKNMKVNLEEMGSFVWKTIDGEKTVLEIGECVKAEFGEEAEPLYERLATYINILRNNKFITLEKK